jgi:hypothetical protein
VCGTAFAQVAWVSTFNLHPHFIFKIWKFMTQNYWKFQSRIFPSPIEKLMDALLEAHSTLDIFLLEFKGCITISFQE